MHGVVLDGHLRVALVVVASVAVVASHQNRRSGHHEEGDVVHDWEGMTKKRDEMGVGV